MPTTLKSKSKKLKTFKRLNSHTYKGIRYVLAEEVLNFHGKSWFDQWSHAMGEGNTGIIIPNEYGDKFGIYYHDYERFADLIDKNKPTYFD